MQATQQTLPPARLQVRRVNVSTTHMTPEQWIAVPDNPYQRNTAHRLDRAIETHLNNFSSMHSMVQMAILPDGTRYKLDGHTRALAWQERRVVAPEFVVVAVHHVNTIEEVKALYSHNDSPTAVENSYDRAFSAGNGHNLRNLNANHYARTGRFGSPAQYASSFRRGNINIMKSMDVYTAVLENKTACEDLIDLNPPLSAFVVGVAAAFILSHWKYGYDANTPNGSKLRHFWQEYRNNAGSKIGQEADGVQTLTSFVLARKSGKRLTNDGPDYVCSVALACVDAYMGGRLYKTTPKGIDVTNYVPLAQRRPAHQPANRIGLDLA